MSETEQQDDTAQRQVAGLSVVISELMRALDGSHRQKQEAHKKGAAAIKDTTSLAAQYVPRKELEEAQAKLALAEKECDEAFVTYSELANKAELARNKAIAKVEELRQQLTAAQSAKEQAEQRAENLQESMSYSIEMLSGFGDADKPIEFLARRAKEHADHLQTQLADARDALVKYGAHFPECVIEYCSDSEAKCTCGLDAASTPPQAEQGEAEKSVHWYYEVSSGYPGYRCKQCADWCYVEKVKPCQCMKKACQQKGDV